MIFLICEASLTDSNSILKRAFPQNKVEYYVSGSSMQMINGSRSLTKPQYAFDQMEKKYDWCSNCPRSYDEHPWIILGVKNQIMKLNGYFIRAGCCTDLSSDACCCIDADYYCCECCLYSWSFQISNDNITWKTVHKVESDRDLRRCKEKTYTFSETYSAKFARLIQDKPCPGDPPCIALNKIELIGTYDDDSNLYGDGFENDEDDVSIIGHISKHVKVE